MATNRKTVLIADDEELICELLKKIILWDDLKLDLIGESHNGRELYEAILQYKPDIVITDISMPEMDGIELIGKVRQEGIVCHFVIVSGYRQFEYAHNALKYNVEDYILKPVDADELNGTLNELVKKINIYGDKKDIVQGKKLMERFFLNHVITELPEKQLTLEEIKQEYRVHFEEGIFQILYVKSDIMMQMQDFIEDSSSIQNKISNTFYNMFQNICTCILTDQKLDMLKICINYPIGKVNEVNEKIKEYFNYIQNFVDLFKEYKLTIGIGGTYNKVEDLSISEREAMAAIWSRILIGCDRVIHWSYLDLEDSILTENEKKDFYRDLKRNFELLEIDIFQKQIYDFFEIAKKRFSSTALMDILSEILELFLETEESLFPERLNEDYIRKQYLYGLNSAVSFPMLINAVINPINEAMESLLHYVKQQDTKPVRIAITYVEENYSQQIRLEDVASQAALNPVYFSNIFKKETGENFTDYLANYRMNVAKELLRSTNNTISEISSKTGYSDSRYFSKQFKKIVGIKPSAYRRIYG